MQPLFVFEHFTTEDGSSQVHIEIAQIYSRNRDSEIPPTEGLNHTAEKNI